MLTSRSNVMTVYTTINDSIEVTEHMVLAMIVQHGDRAGHCKSSSVTDVQNTNQERLTLTRPGDVDHVCGLYKVHCRDDRGHGGCVEEERAN